MESAIKASPILCDTTHTPTKTAFMPASTQTQQTKTK